jgi:selenocysteine-specific elongation factor
VREASVARLPGWKPGAGSQSDAQRRAVLDLLGQAGAEPPTVAELAAALPGLDVPGLLRFLSREGRVVAVGKDRYYEAGVLKAERDRIVTALKELGPSPPAALRDRLGRSRKWLIPLLEWADREGVTVRQGDRRTLGPRAALDGAGGAP